MNKLARLALAFSLLAFLIILLGLSGLTGLTREQISAFVLINTILAIIFWVLSRKPPI